MCTPSATGITYGSVLVFGPVDVSRSGCASAGVAATETSTAENAAARHRFMRDPQWWERLPEPTSAAASQPPLRGVTALPRCTAGVRTVQASGRYGRDGGGRSARLDVLVDPEEVLRVVRRLDAGQAVVVVAVARAHPLLALVHHHVHVRAAGRVGVQRVEVVDGPVPDRLDVLRVGV